MLRLATASDAIGAIEVVRQSISDLCVADHQNDPATLDRWLANKTPEMFESWIANPDHFCVVEEVRDGVKGVGLLRKTGELLLFYIAPDCQRTGLGRSIHAALEAKAIQWALPRLYLESTQVARPFYESMGYQVAGPERLLFGVLRVYPYEKRLQPRPMHK